MSTSNLIIPREKDIASNAGKKLEHFSSAKEHLQDLEVVSFAMNWFVYRTKEDKFLVGTEDNISKSFHDVNIAISYMMEQIYG